MCWVSPTDSSGVDGSGLEITSVFYNGKLVMSRGHMPVLNVKYNPAVVAAPTSLTATGPTSCPPSKRTT